MRKDTRTKLIDAGTRLFAQRGFAAVSIRELSQAANTNPAMISYYFGGKEGLYAAVLEAQFQIVRDILEETSKLPLSPLDRIKAYAAAVLRVHRQQPCLMKFMHGEMLAPTPQLETVIKRHIAQIYEFVQRAIDEGIAAGQFRPDIDPGFAAVALAGIMNFFFLARPVAATMLPPGNTQDEQYVRQALKIYLNGVQNRAS